MNDEQRQFAQWLASGFRKLKATGKTVAQIIEEKRTQKHRQQD